MSLRFGQLSSWLIGRIRARKAGQSASLQMPGRLQVTPAFLVVGVACVIGLINILAVEARTLRKFQQAEPALAEFRQTLKPDDRMQLVGFTESWFTWYFRHHLISNPRLTQPAADGVSPKDARFVAVRAGQVPSVADAGLAPKLSARLLLDQSNSAMDVFERVKQSKVASPMQMSHELDRSASWLGN